MEKRILQWIKDQNLVQAGDAVLTGVSGGADSLALLHFLHHYQETLGITVAAAHVHHGLRGEAADADAAFVHDFCQLRGIPFYFRQVDVKALSETSGMTLEDAGRQARRDFFKQLMRQEGFTKTALAHHLNDQAETVLMRLIRGTGVKGAGGMLPLSRSEGLVVIRPLLKVTKQEILDYCTHWQLSYQTDATNFEEIATRNRIRLSLVPMMETVNPKVQQHLSDFAELAAEYEDFFEIELEKQAAALIDCREDLAVLHLDGWRQCHPLLQKALLRKCIKAIKGSLKEVEYNHILHLQRQLMGAKTSWQLMLPGGLCAVRRYEDFWIQKQEIQGKKAFGDYLLPTSGEVRIPSEGIGISLRLFSINNLKELKNSDEKYFDYGKIKGQLHLRSRSTGDYFYQKGMQGRKKLKDYFIDRKIDRDIRDQLPLLAFGHEILWCPGWLINVAYLPDAQTKTVLGVRLFKIENQRDEE